MTATKHYCKILASGRNAFAAKPAQRATVKEVCRSLIENNSPPALAPCATLSSRALQTRKRRTPGNARCCTLRVAWTALCALLLCTPSGCVRSRSGQDFYRLDVPPRTCTRPVELLRERPSSAFKEVALLGATCHGLAPYQCESRLLEQACTRRADAVIIIDQTFIGKKAEPRRMMTGSAIVYLRTPPSTESASSAAGANGE
jgi:hypothetical protein